MKLNRKFWFMAAFAAVNCAGQALAGVTAEQAAKLKNTLTPYGAERAGNKDGSIPTWEGGYKHNPGQYKNGESREDLYPNEKPTLVINAQNVSQYADKLSEGVKGLIKKYPNTFSLQVYPTHRTAAAPQWVYDNIAKNATRAKLSADGQKLEGAYGGIPFPIPSTGIEVMWNHKLQYLGEGYALNVAAYSGGADGKITKASNAYSNVINPYYFKDGSLETYKGVSSMWRVWVTGPAHKAGEQFLLHQFTDRPMQVWQYLVGQRRVRKAPTFCCDTPEEVNSGINYVDEAYGFYGDLDRYDWKLVGKREMYIPYNGNKLVSKEAEKVGAQKGNHVNPDLVRWEKHRVWVVEATVKEGKRHAIPKRTFYVDEDTWSVILSDGYDAQGTLWRVGISVPFVAPEGPFVYGNGQWSVYDLVAGNYLAGLLTDWSNSSYKWHFKTYAKEATPLAEFTPDAMAGSGVR
ncbi:DUF1329 domain-containing protein [Ferribacterium limneticum]|uniref:DUF1329 domain-containing protein n=1 Tax=Ferribacterium limneticum TaxID=76259 RepID=UPI001CFB3ACF|nr:DUF1329 domain-containing protein [Ferribacterium limneticum]UCV17780.1 DUF1329 domain-containing protein [Ferribacterium limneticum]